MAGCILVDSEKLHVINRSPAYKNQYVHRRDSISVATLSEEEIQKRMKLGLVTAPSDASSVNEEWEDIEEEEVQENEINNENDGGYILNQNGRSSIDMGGLVSNTHDGGSFDTASGSVVGKKQRMCSREPSFAAIREVDEEVETETVDGDDDIELRDA